MHKAVFAAGCFWGVQAAFDEMPGVIASEVGYTNGRIENPTYDDVCSHTSGHAEAVQVEFDPAKISYEALVETFFALHDPTQLNRQGPDIGDQYRSGIFTYDAEQEKIARAVKDRLEKAGRFKRPIATIIEPVKKFWRAEEYHQKWDEKHGGSSCRI